MSSPCPQVFPREQQPSRSATQAQLGAEGAVQIFEYRCALEKGAPVQPEQFSRPAISVVTSGVFGFRSDRDDQLLAAGSVLLGNPGQQYEISHEHMGGDRCLIFRFEPAALALRAVACVQRLELDPVLAKELPGRRAARSGRTPEERDGHHSGMISR